MLACISRLALLVWRRSQSSPARVGLRQSGCIRYYGKAQLTRLPLFDLERVEVLRGPQAILFGKNSMALIGNNLTDERTISFGGTQVLAGSLTQGTGMAYYAFTNRPRYYALQGTYRF